MSELRTLLIGTYGETGLRPVRIEQGMRIAGGTVSGTADASFAAWSPRHGRLYVVREDAEGAIDVVAPEEEWRWLFRVATNGAEPCHCALDESESFLAVANYGSGSVTVFALDVDGTPLPDPWRYQGKGSGPNAERQEGPHAHWVGFSPDQRWLIQTDLGTDQIRAFAFDRLRGVVGPPTVAFSAPAGSGPRWLAFHPSGQTALLVSELDSTLTLLAFADGAFHPLDRRRTAPEEAADNLGGHLVYEHADRRAYVTNRGHDSVAVFAVADQGLELLETVPSGGTSPRYLYLDRDRGELLVAHEEEGPVSVFAVMESGRLKRLEETIDAARGAWIGEVALPI